MMMYDDDVLIQINNIVCYLPRIVIMLILCLKRGDENYYYRFIVHYQI